MISFSRTKTVWRVVWNLAFNLFMMFVSALIVNFESVMNELPQREVPSWGIIFFVFGWMAAGVILIIWAAVKPEPKPEDG